MKDEPNRTLQELQELQRWMLERLRQTRALTRDTSAREQAESHFAQLGSLSSLEQLEIYREQFWLRHTAALLEDFPGLSRLLGQEDWERVVEGYLERFPPHSWSLHDLGAHMSSYLAAAPPREPAALFQEMAELEWAYVEAFFAAPTTPADFSLFLQGSAEQLAEARLELAPSLRLLRSSFPVAPLRRSLLAHNELELPAPGRHFLVVYQDPERNLWDRPLSEPAFTLLEALAQGKNLGDACERVDLLFPESNWEQHLSSWFEHWARWGWLVTGSSSQGSHCTDSGEPLVLSE